MSSNIDAQVTSMCILNFCMHLLHALTNYQQTFTKKRDKNPKLVHQSYVRNKIQRAIPELLTWIPDCFSY